MQDIPRNELLDKLAAGWKVRMKNSTKKVNNLNDLAELQGIYLCCLVEEDWEGEPPEPVLKESKCSIIHAFWQLRNGAAFIRRTAWGKTQITLKPAYVNISGCDILATDWEVWG